MELFWAERIAIVEDQSSKTCRVCAKKLMLVRIIANPDSGAVIHMFECACGERIGLSRPPQWPVSASTTGCFDP
jgi:hypothetical protein